MLVALLRPAHEAHARAVAWFAHVPGREWATCPITESGLTRILSNRAFSRDCLTPWEAQALLAANTRAAEHEFWPDDLPCTEALEPLRGRLLGHRQVTDAYLLALALRRGAQLATLDRGVAELVPASSPQRNSIVLVVKAELPAIRPARRAAARSRIPDPELRHYFRRCAGEVRRRLGGG